MARPCTGKWAALIVRIAGVPGSYETATRDSLNTADGAKGPPRDAGTSAASEGRAGTAVLLNSKKAFGATVNQYEHESAVLGCTMKFSVIDGLPQEGKKPVIYWLSGLTCNDRNFVDKAGAFEAAVQCGVALVCPGRESSLLTTYWSESTLSS